MNGRRTGGYMTVKDVDEDGEMDAPNALMRLDSVSQNKMSLSYNNMLMNEDGSILTQDNIKELRERYGYCVTCTGDPVKLFEVKKSKLNPLWKSKEPLSSAHESLNGVCLRCNPALDPQRMSRQGSMYRGSTRSLRKLGEGSIRSLPNPGKSMSMRELPRQQKSDSRLALPRQNSLNIFDLAEESPAPPKSSLSTIHSIHEEHGNSSSQVIEESPKEVLPDIPLSPSPIVSTRNLAMNLTPESEDQQTNIQRQPPSMPDMNNSNSSLKFDEDGMLGSSHDASPRRPSLEEQFSNPDFGGADAVKSHRKKKKKSKSRSKSKKSASESNLNVQETPRPSNSTNNPSTDFHQSMGTLDLGNDAWFSDNTFNFTPAGRSFSKSPVLEPPSSAPTRKPSKRKEKKKSSSGETDVMHTSTSDRDIWGEPTGTLDDFIPETKPTNKAAKGDEVSWPAPPSLDSEVAAQKKREEIDELNKETSPVRRNGIRRSNSPHPSMAVTASQRGFGPPSRHSSIEEIAFDKPAVFSPPPAKGRSLTPMEDVPRPNRRKPRSLSPFRPSAETHGFVPPPRPVSAMSEPIAPKRRESMDQTSRHSSSEPHGYGPPAREGPSRKASGASFGTRGSRSMGNRSESGLSEKSIDIDKPEFFKRSTHSAINSSAELPQISHSSLTFSEMQGQQMNEETDPAVIAQKAAEVDALLRDVSAAGNVEFMVDVLTNSIRSHQYYAKVLEICFKRIWDFCKFNEENKVHIMKAGIPDDIVSSMRRHRQSVVLQERACGCLWSLAVNQYNRIELVRAGAVRGVFRAVEDHFRDEEFLETALGCLRTISPDREGRHAIQQLLGAQRVCRAMSTHRSSIPIQRDGCAFLSNVAVDMDKQEVSVVSREEVEAVVRALSDHMRNEAVAGSACFALKNYTYEEKNLRTLRGCEDVFSLLEDAAKYSTKHEIRVDANEVLERLRLLCEEDDALEVIALGSMQEAMQNPKMTVDESASDIQGWLKEYDWSEKLICYSLDCLLTIGNKGSSHLHRITQLDVVKVVVDAMRKQKKSPKVQERACELMKFLAENGTRSGAIIRDADGCGAIISALRVHRGVEAVQIPAFGALKVLSRDPRCHEVIENNGGLHRLGEMMERQDSRLNGFGTRIGATAEPGPPPVRAK